jgi:predicted DNA-binding transcriptional regulator YafY
MRHAGCHDQPGFYPGPGGPRRRVPVPRCAVRDLRGAHHRRADRVYFDERVRHRLTARLRGYAIGSLGGFIGTGLAVPLLALGGFISDTRVVRAVTVVYTFGFLVAAFGTAISIWGAMTAGVALPPMLLEADEAVAVLLSLQEAAAGTTHAADAALSALEKLRQVTPARLRSDTEALTRHSSDLRLGRIIGREPRFVDVAVLVLLARACRQRRRVRERADDASGHDGERILEPLHLVRTMGHWYLVAYVLDDHAWRPLRVDHLGQLATSTAPSTHGSYDGAVADLVTAHMQAQIQSVTGVVRVHAPAAAVAPWIEPAWGRFAAESPTTTIVEAGADTYASMARWLSLVNAEITVLEPHELRQAFAELAKRAARAAQPGPGEPAPERLKYGSKARSEPTAADPRSRSRPAATKSAALSTREPYGNLADARPCPPRSVPSTPAQQDSP